jgi:hypothetical protein
MNTWIVVLLFGCFGTMFSFIVGYCRQRLIVGIIKELRGSSSSEYASYLRDLAEIDGSLPMERKRGRKDGSYNARVERCLARRMARMEQYSFYQEKCIEKLEVIGEMSLFELWDMHRALKQ